MFLGGGDAASKMVSGGLGDVTWIERLYAVLWVPLEVAICV